MGLPMRIALAFLIIAICTPPLITAANDFSQQADMNGMTDDLDRISEAATKAYLGGVGTTVSTFVDLIPGYEMELGGDGADSYSVKVVRGGEIIEKRYLAHPSVPLLGKTVLDGSCTLVFECVNENAYGVKVTAV